MRADQGWPKFANAIFYTNETAGQTGIGVALYAPASATTRYGRVQIDTEYPFGDNATITIDANESTSLYLRVPGWATEAVIPALHRTAPVGNGTIQRVPIVAGTSSVTILFKPRIRIEADGLTAPEAPDTRGEISYSVHRGAIMYSLPLGLNYSRTQHYAFESSDYDVRPTTPWAFALDANVSAPEATLEFVHDGYRPGFAPFNKTADPARAEAGFWPSHIVATVRDVSGSWALQPSAAKGQAGWTPHVPPASPACAGGGGKAQCGEPVQALLVPHGGTALRIGTLPLSGLG